MRPKLSGEFRVVVRSWWRGHVRVGDGWYSFRYVGMRSREIESWMEWFRKECVAVFEVGVGPESPEEQFYNNDCFQRALRISGLDVEIHDRTPFRIWFRRKVGGEWEDEWVAPR